MDSSILFLRRAVSLPYGTLLLRVSVAVGVVFFFIRSNYDTAEGRVERACVGERRTIISPGSLTAAVVTLR